MDRNVLTASYLLFLHIQVLYSLLLLTHALLVELSIGQIHTSYEVILIIMPAAVNLSSELILVKLEVIATVGHLKLLRDVLLEHAKLLSQE